MKKIFAALCLTLLGSGATYAGELDFYLSGESLQAGYAIDTGAIGYGGGNIIFGGYYNTDKDYQGNVGLMVVGTPTSNQPFTYGLGVMGYFSFLDEPDSKVQAVTLGGLFKYHIPAKMPMAIGARLFYAPEVTTFGDGQDFLDVSADYEFTILPSATLYVGYRLMRSDLKDFGNYDIEDQFHIGARLMF